MHLADFRLLEAPQDLEDIEFAFAGSRVCHPSFLRAAEGQYN